jgi:hypothetical protein
MSYLSRPTTFQFALEVGWTCSVELCADELIRSMHIAPADLDPLQQYYYHLDQLNRLRDMIPPQTPTTSSQQSHYSPLVPRPRYPSSAYESEVLTPSFGTYSRFTIARRDSTPSDGYYGAIPSRISGGLFHTKSSPELGKKVENPAKLLWPDQYHD